MARDSTRNNGILGMKMFSEIYQPDKGSKSKKTEQMSVNIVAFHCPSKVCWPERSLVIMGENNALGLSYLGR